MSKCRICRSVFVKRSISHKDCSPACAIEGLRIDKAKRARIHHKAEKIRLKSRREWLADCQRVVNAYVRKRDEGKPCISCQRMHKGQVQAGHYLSVGARPELRFEAETNIHLQCSACNNYLSGNIVLYRINLIKKIGLERVEWLEGPHPPAKWTIEELQAIIAEYKKKLKDLS